MPEEGTKYDWLKNEVVGNTANLADIYQDGYMPEQFELGEADDYWSDEEMRKPFEERYGAEEGRNKFDEVYDQSSDRLDAFRKGRFDISTTSERRMLPTNYGKRAAALGLTKLYNNPSIAIADIPEDLEGRDIVNGVYSRPEHSFRQGAFDNGVLINGELVDFDDYRESGSDPVIYAVNDEGAPLLHNGKSYLRPLADAEEKKAHEEYATKFSDYMGFNGLDTPDWYVLKFAPKNASNFVADVLDSGAELLKSIERLTLDRGEEPSDAYNSITDFQNMVGGYLHGSTSDQGRQDWTTTEGITDGLSQVVLQLGGMYGVAVGTKALLTAVQMASATEATRAASVASRMFMSTLAADGLHEQAQTANLSPREQGIIHGLSLLGYYKIARLSEWVIGTSPAMQKLTMDALIKKNLNLAQKALPEGGKFTVKGLSQVAKNTVRDLNQAVRNTLANPNAFAGYITAGSLESLEEVSESVMELGIKETYDRIYQPIFGNTAIGQSVDTDRDVRFNTDYSTLASELTQAAALGFAGGAMARRFFRRSRVDQSNYYKYLASNQFPEVKRRLQTLHQKGALGDATLNAEGNPKKDGEKSRNDLAYDAVLSDMNSAELTWNSEGLNNVFDTNEKKMAFIHSKEGLRESSIGTDLSTHLNNIDNYTEDITALQLDTKGDNTEKIAEKQKLIDKSKAEIKAIRDGKRVTKYLQEVLYNVNIPITPFQKYYDLNESAKGAEKSRQNILEKMETAATEANVDNFEDYSALTPETGERLKKEVKEKYKPEPTEDGTIPTPPQELIDLPVRIDKLVEKGQNLPSPELEILSNFDADRKPTYTFQEILEGESQKLTEFEEKGTGVYDDVEGLSSIVNNLQSRTDQLLYSQVINPDVNTAHTKLDENPDEVVFSADIFKNTAEILMGYTNQFKGLLQIAKENRDDFEGAILKANDAVIEDHIEQLDNSVTALKDLEDDLFQGEIPDEVSSKLVAISNAESSEQKQRLIIETQKLIYDHFANDKQLILDRLYDKYDLISDRLTTAQRAFGSKLGISIDKSEAVIPNQLRYLKKVITLDPKVFYSHYASILNARPDQETKEVNYTHSRHILSPAQRDIAQELAAFVMDNSIKANEGLRSGENARVYDITQGKFFTSWQGAGKTITVAWAAKIVQMMRGGKVLVAANDEVNRKNMADTMKGLGVSLDESLSGAVPFDKLMSHLKSDKQGDIGLIVYDEATLLQADQAYELDLTLRQINSARTDTPIKVIYVGDKTQIGAVRQNTVNNIASASNVSIETTNELKFSYRTGNDQINSSLEHIRSIVAPKNEGVSFSSKYDMEEAFSGARFEDGDFNTAMNAVMKKLTSNDDWIIIADVDRQGAIRSKHDVPDGRMLTPLEAQGKQWDYVIVDIETAKVFGEPDRIRKKTLLSTVGRAKKFVLARVENNQLEGVSRNMSSVEGETVNVSASISEDGRKAAKEVELSMVSGLDLENIAENDLQGSHETIKVKATKPIVIVEDVKTEAPTVDERQAIDAILNKMKEFPKRKGTTSDKAYVMMHSFYSYAESYEDGDTSKPTSLLDIPKILDLKNKLLHPVGGEDLDVSFSLMVHGNELPTRILTHTNPAYQVNYEKDETKQEFNTDDKLFVIYATIHEAGKPVYKISMGSLNTPEDFGLKQSDLFDIEIPFTETQSTRYLQSIINSVETRELTDEEKVNTVFAAPPSYKSRNFQMKGTQMSVEEFKKLNGNFWNFASDIIYSTSRDKERGGTAEKQTWLVYSPTIPTDRLDKIIRFDQDQIGADNSDVRKVAIDGGRVMALQQGFDAIQNYYSTDVKTRSSIRGTLPHIAKSRIYSETGLYNIVSEELGLGDYNPKTHTDVTIYNRLQKSRKTATKNKSNKLLSDALNYAFFDNQAWKQHKKNQATKYGVVKGEKGRTEKGIKRTKALDEPIAPENLSFSPSRFMNWIINASKRSDPETSKNGSTLLNKVSNNLFPNGFYYPVKAIEGETEPRISPFAIADASPEDYVVNNLVHPPMPIHNIKFDFFKDVISNEDAYKVKIETRTNFETIEDASTRETSTVSTTETPLIAKSIVIPKNTEGNESTGDFLTFAADANDLGSKASMFDIFKTYFNEKPYNHKFSRFIEYYNRKIYNSVFKLAGNNPEIVDDKIDGVLKDLRKATRTNGTEIDKAIKIIGESGGSLDRKLLLENDAYANILYDYIIGKEFDSLLALKFPAITKVDKDGKIVNIGQIGTYAFNSKLFKENQLTENKEKISHLERGNDMVKMHMFNMPILDRRLVKGNEVLLTTRYADQRAIAKIIRAVRDVNITDVESARRYFGERVSDPELYSFYKRFLDPEPYEVKTDKAFETHHSISSLNTDIAEDTITGVLSFIASGNETEYGIMDHEENELQARFTEINVNRFRDNLELSIKATGPATVQQIDNETYDIKYGRKGESTWRIHKNGNIEYLGQSNRNHLGQVLQTFGIPSINFRQYQDVWDIKDKGGHSSTPTMLFEFAKYVAKPMGERGPFMRGGELNDWLEWTNSYQNIKQVDSAFSYTNISGDRVNLISLSYPMTRSNQRIKNLQESPGTLLNNAFVNGDVSIDSFLLKEGYKGRFNSRANRQMTEKEQMEFDFRYMYLRSLLKAKLDKPQSVIFNPMVFADKSADAVIRTTGQFLPTNGDGSINIRSLRDRTVKSISQYNVDLGRSIISTYIDSFEEIDVKHEITPAKDNPAPSTILSKLRQINARIDKLTKVQKDRLPSTGLVNQLMYNIEDGELTGVNSNFLKSILPEDVDAQMQSAKGKFDRQVRKHVLNLSPAEIKSFTDKGYQVTQESLLDSYFYNHNYVAHNFSTMHVGSVWQYKGVKAFQDQIKRNSQITTNRQKFVLRPLGYSPNTHTIKQGRKLGKYSKTAIVTDIQEVLKSINYQGKNRQDIFDGAAFHNLYATIQMKESYGNDLGFNVSSTLKPISSYLDEAVGHSRFDKYASFLISPEMLTEKGDPFVKKINDLMLSSVEFDLDEILDLNNEPIVAGVGIDTVTDGGTEIETITANPPKNLLELENMVRAEMRIRIDAEPLYSDVVKETLDIMVKNGLQDEYLQEVIFDTSVKTGVSNLNKLGSFENTQNISKLNYINRSNEERGLVLDASHDTNKYEGAFPTQIISAVLQGNFSETEGNNILVAIEKIGNLNRDKIALDSENFFKEKLREAINKRGDVGLIHRLVNKANFSFNNKTIQPQLFSAIASAMSDLTVRIKIKGGQQVVGPSYGVFNHPETGEPLKGFDAFNEKGESIKTSKAWLDLVDATDSGRFEEAKEHRRKVHALTVDEFTNVQKPQVIIAPTMFSDFGIPASTELSEIEAGFIAGRYKGTYEDFKKTLDVVLLRIPATNKQSYMNVEVVGFAHDTENTFYTNLDLLYLQGADQDIDKGNLLTYQMEKGKITIPESLDGANTEIELKNFIVNQIAKSSGKSSTLMESTLPTVTSTLEDLAEEYLKTEDALVDYMNPFSQATMFVRGQAGKTNIGIHANGLKTYSSAFHSYKKKGNDLSTYTAKSNELGKKTQRIEGLGEDRTAYFSAMTFYSELINAAVDNAKNPILGALGINEATGNLVNVLAFLGYSPKQVVDFLHNDDVMTVVRAFQKYGEYSVDSKPFKTFQEFADQAVTRKRKSEALQDLQHFARVSEDYSLLGNVLAINREIPNSPHAFYRYLTNINAHLAGVTTIEEFVRSDKGREELISRVNRELVSTGIAQINILQVLNDNENMLSYLKSALIAKSTMTDNSIVYNTTLRIAEEAGRRLERPIGERLYKDINNFTYGLAVDDFLSQGGGKEVVMTVDGFTRTYNLGLVKAEGGQLGRIEFMQEFPEYFKSLKPNRQDTLQNHMTVEVLGREGEEVKILKMEADFRAQSPERKISLMSMMDMLEKGDAAGNLPDLGLDTDSSVKEMLFNYSLIKDRGGNSGTSYTVLFDPSDFEAFDNFFELWTPAYDLRTEMDDLIREATANTLNAPKALKSKKIHPKFRFAIPYKNDKTANDVSDLSEPLEQPREIKISNNAQLVQAIENEFDTIITSKVKSSPKVKFKIEDQLAKAGYVLNEGASSEGNYIWETTAPVRTSIVNPFSGFTNTQNVDIVDSNPDNPDVDDASDNSSTHNDIDTNAPFSKVDFENKEKRRTYALQTNNKVFNTIISVMNSNMGTAAVAMSEAEIKRKFGNKYAKLRGFVQNGVPVINTDRADLDTPMHEMGHLWLTALRYNNAKLYDKIVNEVSEHEMMDKVVEQYPELEGEALAEEVFATLFGLSQQNKALSSYNRTFLTRMRDTMIEFINWVSELLGDIFGIRVNLDDTMLDIMNKVGDRMLSSSMFNFSSADLQILNTLGVSATPLSTELRAIQDNLVRNNLMEIVC